MTLLPGHVVVLTAALLMVLSAATALLWAHGSGQFEGIEEPKHRMMREPWNEEDEE